MRSNWIFGLALPVLALFVCAALESTAGAQATTPPKTEKHEVIKELHAAHKLLVEADHDYDGHRAAAAEAVHKAIKEIEGKHHAKKPHTGAPVAKQPKIHEAQSNSDVPMKQALSILQGVQGEVSAKHPKAVEHVSKAIGEINTALKLK
jgi:hypothetical protein